MKNTLIIRISEGIKKREINALTFQISKDGNYSIATHNKNYRGNISKLNYLSVEAKQWA
jgi:hypothetical protein